MAVLVTFKVKGVQEFIDKLRTAPEVVTRANRDAMQQSVKLVKASALAGVHRDGRHRLSVKYRTTGTDPVTGRVSTNWVGKILEGGARPHEITASHSSVLAFAAGGRPGGIGGVIYTKSVHHPGVHDKQFLLPALMNNVVTIEAIFKRVAEELVDHLAG